MSTTIRIPAELAAPEKHKQLLKELQRCLYGAPTLLQDPIQPACENLPIEVFDLTTVQIAKQESDGGSSIRTDVCQHCPLLTVCRMVCDINERYSSSTSANTEEGVVYGGETFRERARRRYTYRHAHGKRLPWYMYSALSQERLDTHPIEELLTPAPACPEGWHDPSAAHSFSL